MKDYLERLIKQRKDKLEEITKYQMSKSWSNDVNMVLTAYVADSQFVISELEKVYKLLCST